MPTTKKLDTPTKPKQHYAIGYYNRFVQDLFENPVTEEFDIIECPVAAQAKTYDCIEALKADLSNLGLNRKFYNVGGAFLLTVQAVPAPRNA